MCRLFIISVHPLRPAGAARTSEVDVLAKAEGMNTSLAEAKADAEAAEAAADVRRTRGRSARVSTHGAASEDTIRLHAAHVSPARDNDTTPHTPEHRKEWMAARVSESRKRRFAQAAALTVSSSEANISALDKNITEMTEAVQTAKVREPTWS